MKSYSIKEASNILNISEQAIRLYERKKLISPIRNEKNHYREYSMDDIRNIYHIVKLNRLGFSLADIYKFKSDHSYSDAMLLDKIDQVKEEILFKLAEYEYMTMLLKDAEMAKTHINDPQLREVDMDIYYQRIGSSKIEIENDEQNRMMSIGDIGVIYDSSELFKGNSGELAYILCSEFIEDQSFLETNLIHFEKLHYHKFIQIFFKANTKKMFLQQLKGCLKKITKKYKFSSQIVVIPMITIQEENKIWKVILKVLENK